MLAPATCASWPYQWWTDGELRAAIAGGSPMADELKDELDSRRLGRRRSREAAAERHRRLAASFARAIEEEKPCNRT
jgi:hypothetical protein